MPFQPIGDRYLLEFVWQKKIGSIHLPETADQRNIGKVIAVGDGLLEDGKRVEMTLKEGDRVLFMKQGSVEIPQDHANPDIRLFAVSQGKIIGKFIDEDSPSQNGEG